MHKTEGAEEKQDKKRRQGAEPPHPGRGEIKNERQADVMNYVTSAQKSKADKMLVAPKINVYVHTKIFKITMEVTFHSITEHIIRNFFFNPNVIFHSKMKD